MRVATRSVICGVAVPKDVSEAKASSSTLVRSLSMGHAKGCNKEWLLSATLCQRKERNHIQGSCEKFDFLYPCVFM